MSSLSFKFIISAILWSLVCAAPLEEKAENRSKTKGGQFNCVGFTEKKVPGFAVLSVATVLSTFSVHSVEITEIYSLGKNFVKVTLLLKKSLNS